MKKMFFSISFFLLVSIFFSYPLTTKVYAGEDDSCASLGIQPHSDWQNVVSNTSDHVFNVTDTGATTLSTSNSYFFELYTNDNGQIGSLKFTSADSVYPIRSAEGLNLAFTIENHAVLNTDVSTEYLMFIIHDVTGPFNSTLCNMGVFSPQAVTDPDVSDPATEDTIGTTDTTENPQPDIFAGPNSADFKALNPLEMFNSPAKADLSSPGGIISRLLLFAFPIAGLILFVMLVWAGFEIIMGSASGKSIDAGRQRATAAIIGFGLLFVSYWLMQIVEVIFGVTIL